MKKTARCAVLLLVAILLSGCATPYMINRGRDAKDIVTGSFGSGLGAKARIGPLQAGLFVGCDMAGLRGGEFFSEYGRGEPGSDTLEVTTPVKSMEVFRPSRPNAEQRHKAYEATGVFLASWAESDARGPCWHHLTQIEVVAGAIWSIRLGFNPGELLDFILGWTTIDIYSDDIEAGIDDDKSQPLPRPTSTP